MDELRALMATLQARADACADGNGEETLREYERRREQVEGLRDKVLRFEAEVEGLREEINKILVSYLFLIRPRV